MRAEERTYYERRAPEYDDWYLGRGRYADRERPGWEDETRAIEALVAGLPPGRVLDAACGTGFLTQHLRGDVVAIDQSEEMLAIAQAHCPSATCIRADALALPFADECFDLVFTGHFYGHLREGDRERFLAEARRVAPRLLVLDSALRPGVDEEEVQERVLEDGSRFEVYKRYFSPGSLASELGGGDVVFAGTWYVAVAA